MKSYTRVELRDDGSRHFRMQIEGMLQDDLRAAFEGRKLRACRIPKTQSKRMAWHLVLEFDSGPCVVLSSSMTLDQGWEEIGTINIEAAPSSSFVSAEEWLDLPLPDMGVVERLEIVRWQGAGAVADAGLRLCFAAGRLLLVVAEDSAGAMSITLPGDVAPETWQFPAEEYQFVVP